MNRRHLLFSAAALVVVAGTGGKTAALAAEPLAPAPGGGGGLTGHGMDDLRDVLESRIFLNDVAAVYVPLATARDRGYAAYTLASRHVPRETGDDLTRRTRMYWQMLDHMAEQGKLLTGASPFDRPTRMRQGMTWDVRVVAAEAARRRPAA